MPHHLLPNVFGAWFARQLVVLDVTRDRYVLLSLAQSRGVAPHLGVDLQPVATVPSDTRTIQQLIDGNLVTAATFPTLDPKLNTSSPAPRTGGMSADGWRLPVDAFARRPAWSSVAEALWTLRSVHGEVAARGLRGLLALCSRTLREAETAGLRPGQPDDYAPQMRALEWACLVYPKQTKCLEWFAALTLLSARAGLALRLVLGVQTFPFYAHAWAEAGGVVIGDSARRRDELSVILEAPNRFLDLES